VVTNFEVLKIFEVNFSKLGYFWVKIQNLFFFALEKNFRTQKTAKTEISAI
jgi:hypothetical protein